MLSGGRPQSSLGYLTPEEFAAQSTGADRTTAPAAGNSWPAKSKLAGALQTAAASVVVPRSFSAPASEGVEAGAEKLHRDPRYRRFISRPGNLSGFGSPDWSRPGFFFTPL